MFEEVPFVASQKYVSSVVDRVSMLQVLGTVLLLVKVHLESFEEVKVLKSYKVAAETIFPWLLKKIAPFEKSQNESLYHSFLDYIL